MTTLQRIDTWHKTVKGYIVFGLIELVAAYIIGSLAIDNGRLLLWTLTIILVIGTLQNFVKAVFKKRV